MDNVLLIGASGFIGQEVLRQLSDSDLRIRLLINRSLPDLPSNKKIGLLNGGMQFFDWKSLDDDPPDTIIHTARISGNNSPARYLAGVRGNRANLRLLDWAHSLGNPPHIVYTSGTLIYGSRDENPATEQAAIRPISFQRSYLPAEKPFLKTNGQPENGISVVRPSWVYGSGSWFYQFYFRVMKQEGFVPQFSRGENFMSLISLQDCARMIIDVARQSKGGAVYNLSVDEPMRQSEFCRILSSLTGKPVKILPYWWIRLKYGRAVTEAMTFSLIVKSAHPMISDFKSTYANHIEGLKNTLRNLEGLKTEKR